jgi:hypothetical protein
MPVSTDNSKELKRLTTEYLATEDRIRLSGEVDPQTPVVIWLTQRLLLRMVPALLEWLQKELEKSPLVAASTKVATSPAAAGVKDFLQQAAQQSARSAVTPQEPVRAGRDSPELLATAINVARLPQGIRLTFRGAAGDQQTYHFSLAAQPLRQWLAILQDVTLRAEWPQQIWPEWMQKPTLPQEPRALH